MEQRVLVGSTGFVGGNLLKSGVFQRSYHSTDIQQGFGLENDLVVYAGVPAAMFLANQNPQADLEIMGKARENLRRLNPKKVVLISSICVFADSKGKTESDMPTKDGLAAYGANRLQLEQWVREDWPDALIVRLPALYGPGLKKNFLYDLHTITPALLRPDKYQQLAEQSPLVAKAYSDAGNGFYKLNGSQDAARLKAWFTQSDFNALAFTDSRSVYQFYDLRRLWKDISLCLQEDLRCAHLATAPVSAQQVHQAVTGKPFENHLAGQPFDYDLRTEYAQLLGGEGQYLQTAQQELESIADFMKGWTE
ncbi:MAG: sugar nucleotide-binding protein [Candidatus Fournierella pullistercoris]|uniref:Sugar nucleotide-binding protein n=1 Tax=Candidatus Allofournierella pullistercoris TaxID=2838597 RepID=A0A948T2K1_9FIRM|nr:sugar nucleotide-binding protein [Candidatus Fournierella pullistercoris]